VKWNIEICEVEERSEMGTDTIGSKKVCIGDADDDDDDNDEDEDDNESSRESHPRFQDLNP
jgi:hypothetical protein